MNLTTLGRKVAWALAWTLCGLTIIPFVRLRARNRRNVPRRGAGLLVANHVTFFDPVTVAWASFRRAHGVGTDAILRVPIFGKMVPWLSVIPFSKGLKDRGAMVEIQRRIDRGAVVMIFPEGDRCWTGRMMPVGHGIGRLAIRLGVPVLCCRQTTGHLQWPRWATYPRLIPLRMEFLPPVTYPPTMTPAEVTADIVGRIQIDPEAHLAPRTSWGFRLAEGLPEFLWACPTCFEMDGLGIAPASGRNGVVCRACERRWTVDLSCRLHPGDGGPPQTVAAAHVRILEHFGALPAADRDRFVQTGVALDGTVDLLIVTRGVRKAATLGAGVLQLSRHGLSFGSPSDVASVEIPFSAVKAVLIQLGDLLQVITHETAYQIQPARQSRFLWKHFIDRHLAAARESP